MTVSKEDIAKIAEMVSRGEAHEFEPEDVARILECSQEDALEVIAELTEQHVLVEEVYVDKRYRFQYRHDAIEVYGKEITTQDLEGIDPSILEGGR